MSVPVLCQVILPAKSGIPKDNATMSFVFAPDAADATHAAGIRDDLNSKFFNFATGGVKPSNFIGPSVDLAAGATTKFYDLTGHLDGSPHGSPFYLSSFPLEAGTPSGNLPNEVAVVLSFNSDLTGILEESGATRPRARHRGRVYFGPLHGGVADVEAVTSRVKVQAGFRSCLAGAGAQLMTSAHRWCVWSRALSNVFEVVGGHVDDAFDTQRRRGQAPTTRTLF